VNFVIAEGLGGIVAGAEREAGGGPVRPDEEREAIDAAARAGGNRGAVAGIERAIEEGIVSGGDIEERPGNFLGVGLAFAFGAPDDGAKDAAGLDEDVGTGGGGEGTRAEAGGDLLIGDSFDPRQRRERFQDQVFERGGQHG
jgi:hypothetical protein